MKDVLETLAKLPPRSAAVFNGEAVFIRRGATEVAPAFLARDRVDVWNHEHGVTRAQAQAMLIGLTQGWDADGADPDTHDPDEANETLFTFAQPMMVTIAVRARSSAEAASRASTLASTLTEWVNDCWCDAAFGSLGVSGTPYIIEEDEI